MTTRDSDALKNEKWAASGSDGITTAGLTRSTGWPQSYSQTGGNNPEREVINQLFRELTALAVEFNKSGILAWDTSISYLHPAYVVGSDNRLYVSIRNNNGIDPTTDSNESDWKPVIATTDGTIDAPAPPPDASSTVKGIVELATATETQTGTDVVRAVTPAGLASRNATTTRQGLVERATQAEADSGADTTRYMPSALVKRRIEQAQTSFDRLTTGTSWSVPAWARMVFVEVVGGGAGGAGGGNRRSVGEGGRTARHLFLASSLGTSVTYAIGAGGTSGGGNGGNTVFAGHAVGLGGRGAVLSTALYDPPEATGQMGANGGEGGRSNAGGTVGETGLPTTVGGGAGGAVGTSTSDGGAGSAGTNSLDGLGGGGGGGGGGWSPGGSTPGGNGGAGGAGGIPGGGGGAGGKGGYNATDATGGAGGRGEIRIWAW